MRRQPEQFEVVRVVGFRDSRFKTAKAHYLRPPKVGDTGTVLEVNSEPERGFEVECSDPASGQTVWLEAMYPEEVEIVTQSEAT